MNKYWLGAFALAIAGAGYWAGVGRDGAVTQREMETPRTRVKTGETGGRSTRTSGQAGRASDRSDEIFRTEFPSPEQRPRAREEQAEAPSEARTYDMDDPLEREQLAASLRDKGLGEAEIRQVLKEDIDDRGPNAQGSGRGEARAYNMDDPAEREQLAASLREGGSSEEEIRQILRLDRDDSGRGHEGTPEAGPQLAGEIQARAYDMDDPFEREQLATSLREQGIPEREIRSIMRDAPAEDSSLASVPSSY